MPTAAVHEWVRLAWQVSSGNRFLVDTVGDLIRSSSFAPSSHFAAPLLSLPLAKSSSDHSSAMGSLEFLLRCCFPTSVTTRLFAPNAPLRDFAALQKTHVRKELTLPRLLEVAPPLRGRLFSVAGQHQQVPSSSIEIELLSNFHARRAATAPPWDGCVSSQLDVVSAGADSAATAAALFVRSGSHLLSQSNAAKKKLSQQLSTTTTVSSGRIRNEELAFADALARIGEIDSGCSVMFLCAGTGFAPVRFWLQRNQQWRQRAVDVSLVIGLRNPLPSIVPLLGGFQIAPERLVVGRGREIPSQLPAFFRAVKARSAAPKSPLRLFSCGPAGFLAACRSSLTAAELASDDQEGVIVWSNDDWSS
jgi:hypothetical protein